jgi:hypothetical protein
MCFRNNNLSDNLNAPYVITELPKIRQKISINIWYAKKAENTDRPYRQGAFLKNFTITVALTTSLSNQ